MLPVGEEVSPAGNPDSSAKESAKPSENGKPSRSGKHAEKNPEAEKPSSSDKTSGDGRKKRRYVSKYIYICFTDLQMGGGDIGLISSIAAKLYPNFAL